MLKTFAPILACLLLTGCVSHPQPQPSLPPIEQAQTHVAVAGKYVADIGQTAGIAAGYLAHASDTLADLATTVPAANVPAVVSTSNDVAAAQAQLRQIQGQVTALRIELDETNALLVATSRQVERLKTEHAQAIDAEREKTRKAIARAEKAESFWGYRWGKTIDGLLIAIVAIGVPLLIAGVWFSISTHNVGTVAGILKKIGGWLWSFAVSRFTQKAATQ